jgi:hypothetical protein
MVHLCWRPARGLVHTHCRWPGKPSPTHACSPCLLAGPNNTRMPWTDDALLCHCAPVPHTPPAPHLSAAGSQGQVSSAAGRHPPAPPAGGPCPQSPPAAHCAAAPTRPAALAEQPGSGQGWPAAAPACPTSLPPPGGSGPRRLQTTNTRVANGHAGSEWQAWTCAHSNIQSCLEASNLLASQQSPA